LSFKVNYLFIFGFIFLIGVLYNQDVKCPLKSTCVPPTTTFKGQFRKGYVRKSVSTNPNAIRNQSKSKYYYKTKGKYLRYQRRYHFNHQNWVVTSGSNRKFTLMALRFNSKFKKKSLVTQDKSDDNGELIWERGDGARRGDWVGSRQTSSRFVPLT
jgi:hypothetical protein